MAATGNLVDLAGLALIDVEQVCEVLRVSPRTVARMAKTGSLQSVKVGRLVRYTVAEIERYIAANTR